MGVAVGKIWLSELCSHYIQLLKISFLHGIYHSVLKSTVGNSTENCFFGGKACNHDYEDLGL